MFPPDRSTLDWRIAVKTVVFLATMTSLTSVKLQASEPNTRPNFVWILSEDNSFHYLKHFHPNGAEAPNIESMAAKGLTFNNAFSNAPVCSVARTTLMTSCFAPRIGTQFHRRAQEVPLPNGLKMFPAYLQKAGYYTTNRSKTDYNAKASSDVWDESSNKAHWRNRSKAQPFFHMASYNVCHESSLHFSHQTYERTPTQHDPTKVQLAPYHPDTALFRYTHATLLDRMTDVDKIVGNILNELEQDGELENTFVFYFGDHGGVLPRGKGYAYESGLHVPLVIRVPDKWRELVNAKRGSRREEFVSFIDFGPTVLNLAGLSIPEQVDGQPFLGKNIRPQDLPSRNQAIGYVDRLDEKYDLVRTLRKGNFEYVRSFQPFNFDGLENNYRYKMLAYQEWRSLFQEGKLDAVRSAFFQPRAAEALYDLKSDPHEINNLAALPEYQEVLASLRGELTNILKNWPDLSFYPEPFLIQEGFKKPVEFGTENQKEVARLIDIANLQLLPFEEAEPAIIEALNSKNRWERYWGLIVCTAAKSSSDAVLEIAKRIAENDPERLVRVRGAEFLGLRANVDPTAVIAECFKSATSPVEANLILNTAVVLQDSPPGYQFSLTAKDAPFTDRYINDRLEYLKAKK